ncbi:hypothetical protein ACFQ9X_45385 [Catenulispora yoronensis]
MVHRDWTIYPLLTLTFFSSRFLLKEVALRNSDWRGWGRPMLGALATGAAAGYPVWAEVRDRVSVNTQQLLWAGVGLVVAGPAFLLLTRWGRGPLRVRGSQRLSVTRESAILAVTTIALFPLQYGAGSPPTPPARTGSGSGV